MSPVRRAPLALFITFWSLGVILMVLTYVSNPHDPTLRGTAAYGHTSPGELRTMLWITAAEILTFLVVLRPWSYDHAWPRAVVALVLLTPWLLLWGALGMHSGPTTGTHGLWIVLFWLGLVVAAIVSAVGGFRTRRASRARGGVQPE